MNVGEKLRYLREVEGTLRGLNRPMTQAEVVRAIAEETAQPLSQSYLSQIESGARPHMTHGTRTLLARFFKIHPGFLVDDPPGFHRDLTSDLRTTEGLLDEWLMKGADRFAHDPDVSHALLLIAAETDTRSCILLLGAILDTPGLADRLKEVLTLDVPAAAAPAGRSGKASERQSQ